MVKKIKWIFIWLGFKLLKIGLRYRINGAESFWLQPFGVRELVNRNAWILQYVKDKNVLHIGFADAPFTEQRLINHTLFHTHLKQSAKSIFGIDTDKEAVAHYTKITGDLQVQAVSIENIPPQDLVNYELILLGEVLEHVANPISLIDSLQNKLSVGQKLIVTVPNYISFDNLSAVLHNTESIHPDHQWYFSPYTLKNKFNSQHWDCEQFIFGLYGEKKPNLIQKIYPGISDCLIMIFKKTISTKLSLGNKA